MKTKAKPKERYDAVQMVREIRDAHYRRDTDPNFDPAELKRIKAKWTKLLEEQMMEDGSAGVAQPKSGPGLMEQLRRTGQCDRCRQHLGGTRQPGRAHYEVRS